MQENQIISILREQLSKKIIGQKYMIDRILLGLLTDGHILIEGVPGLAKTLAIKSLAHCFDAKFSRIQFTPDLLPADVTGTIIFNQANNEFKISKGPIFANIVLAMVIFPFLILVQVIRLKAINSVIVLII